MNKRRHNRHQQTQGGERPTRKRKSRESGTPRSAYLLAYPPAPKTPRAQVVGGQAIVGMAPPNPALGVAGGPVTSVTLVNPGEHLSDESKAWLAEQAARLAGRGTA